MSDASHRLVTDLEEGDFVVLDNGRPQALTAFERAPVPISVAVLLDASDSMRNSIDVLRAAARQFVAQLQPGDRIQLGAFNHAIRWARPFTSNRDMLRLALDRFGAVGWGTALWPAMDEAINELRIIDGQKILLMFSDGENNLGRLDARAVTNRAIVEDVMVYAITLKTEYKLNGKRVRSVLDPGLPRVTEATGGGYFELQSTDDLDVTFRRVAEELHQQYTLGFEAPELDDKTHAITVHVNRDGLMVRARSSYIAKRR